METRLDHRRYACSNFINKVRSRPAVAVGFGVNVQGANHVIHFTRCWNPAKEDQATDRAYRIGQTKDVFVYYPTIRDAEIQTFEATLDDLLDQRRLLASDMLQGKKDLQLSDFDGVLNK